MFCRKESIEPNLAHVTVAFLGLHMQWNLKRHPTRLSVCYYAIRFHLRRCCSSSMAIFKAAAGLGLVRGWEAMWLTLHVQGGWRGSWLGVDLWQVAICMKSRCCSCNLTARTLLSAQLRNKGGCVPQPNKRPSPPPPPSRACRRPCCPAQTTPPPPPFPVGKALSSLQGCHVYNTACYSKPSMN